MIPAASMVLLALSASASLLAPLAERIGDAGYLTGSFTQIDRWALTQEEETSSGTLHLAHPSLFLLEYSDPDGWLSGFDGEMLYTIEPDIRQVILYPYEAPGSFLHFIERASDSSASETVEVSGDSIIVSVTGDLGEGIQRMRVGYTASDSLPFLFETDDANGNRTTYLMESMETSDCPPDGIFDMIVPEGFVVVSPEGL
jgi:outer membrane lipoprotein-sorting protein